MNSDSVKKIQKNIAPGASGFYKAFWHIIKLTINTIYKDDDLLNNLRFSIVNKIPK